MAARSVTKYEEGLFEWKLTDWILEKREYPLKLDVNRNEIYFLGKPNVDFKVYVKYSNNSTISKHFGLLPGGLIDQSYFIIHILARTSAIGIYLPANLARHTGTFIHHVVDASENLFVTRELPIRICLIPSDAGRVKLGFNDIVYLIDHRKQIILCEHENRHYLNYYRPMASDMEDDSPQFAA